MSLITLTAPKGNISGELSLKGSKSISNRVLILLALSGYDSEIFNLSDADDTSIMKRLLTYRGEKVLDAGDAGTVYRFISAYLALMPGKYFLTGSNRMLQRPIGVLVDALNQLGAKITYAAKSGYPPIIIEKGNFISSDVPELFILSSVSSQYISALLMIAPNLPNGLILNLEGKTVSEPYIDMTLKLMSTFGAIVSRMGNRIVVKPEKYSPIAYEVESDWSSASYYFAMAALSSQDFKIRINSLFADSIQGDAIIAELMKFFGVKTERINNKTIEITKTDKVIPNYFEYDFTNCPDLAQTLAVVLAALNISAKLKGLETLNIKETDRITALKIELEKLGASVDRDYDSLIINKGIDRDIKPDVIKTYKDHRMAMAFAPLSLIYDKIIFDSKEVVHKSYPSFWTDLTKLGFKIK